MQFLRKFKIIIQPRFYFSCRFWYFILYYHTIVFYSAFLEKLLNFCRCFNLYSRHHYIIWFLKQREIVNMDDSSLTAGKLNLWPINQSLLTMKLPFLLFSTLVFPLVHCDVLFFEPSFPAANSKYVAGILFLDKEREYVFFFKIKVFKSTFVSLYEILKFKNHQYIFEKFLAFLSIWKIF